MGFTSFLVIDDSLEIEIAKSEKSANEYLNYTKKHLGDNSISALVKEVEYADMILEIA